ncbi:MAG: hypothetical protein KUG79_09655 [Pseudomonadales bacterium]|nr:hypothetical protein [Pseudomonadales bacterium]
MAYPLSRSMKNKKLLTPAQGQSFDFGELNCHQIQQLPSNASSIAELDSFSTTKSFLGRLKLNSTAILQYTPPLGRIYLAIKPHDKLGAGVLHNPQHRNTIHILKPQSPMWTTGIEGSEYYLLTVQPSLLAKHALNIVDTTILSPSSTFELPNEISNRLIGRLDYITQHATIPSALDLQITHLVLAICEILNGQETNNTIRLNEDPVEAAVEAILQRTPLDTSNQKLNRAFKAAIGISCQQFEAAYTLNLVRRDLILANRTFPQCVTHYGFKDADKLYKDYVKLFTEDPPIALKNLHNHA